MDCALNIVGFAQTVQDMMKAYGGYIIFDGGLNDIRIIGTISTVFICTVCGLGPYYETKVRLRYYLRGNSQLISRNLLLSKICVC